MTLSEAATEPGVCAIKQNVNPKGRRDGGGVSFVEKRKELLGQVRWPLMHRAEFATHAIAGFK